MIETSIPEKKWQTILTLAISALGIVYFLIQALGLGVIWLTSFFDTQSGITQSIPSGLLAWSSLLSSLLLVPVLLHSVYRLRDQEIPAWLDTSQPTINKVVIWLILAYPVVVFLGWLVAGSPRVATFLLGPINLLVAGLPVLWIYNEAQRKLPAGSQVRKWRIFGFSLTIMPVLVIIAELIALMILALIGGLWLAYRLSVNPQLERELMYIFNQINIGGDLDTIIQLLKPYILRPVVIFGALAIFAGIMPMIEEILKPIALWSLAGHKITPREGFVGGLICGAGFALMENVLYFTAAIMAEDWLFMAIGRAGTGVLHMLGSGLVGWGLAKAWRDGKWPFLALTTLGAILFHGVWNSLALVAGVAPLYIYGSDATHWQTLLFYSPLILLLIAAAIALWLINRHFRKKQQIEEDQTESPETLDKISITDD
jgi:hypothetical protein